jgi:cysteine desulfurase
LYIKKGVDIEPLLHGGGHESGMRSGTVAVPSIVGFGKAAEIARNNMGDMKRVSRMVEMIAGSLVGGCGAVRNGDPVNRLPHILSLTLPRLPGAALVGDLSQKGVCVSMGSACRTRRRKSHVLEAMGLDHEKNNHTIRISPSRYTEDMDAFLLIQAIQQADKNPRKLEYL